MEAEAVVIDYSNKNWFYEKNGRRVGAISLDEMHELIKAGTISYGDLVWKRGSKSWEKAELTDLADYICSHSPPPLHASGVNGSLIWILAFAPIIGMLVEYGIAAAVYGGGSALDKYSGQFFFVTFILNVAVGYADERRLRLAGYDTSKFSQWAWFVPVYMLKRSRALGHKPSYLLVWTICFALLLIAPLYHKDYSSFIGDISGVWSSEDVGIIEIGGKDDIISLALLDKKFTGKVVEYDEDNSSIVVNFGAEKNNLWVIGKVYDKSGDGSFHLKMISSDGVESIFGFVRNSSDAAGASLSDGGSESEAIRYGDGAQVDASSVPEPTAANTVEACVQTKLAALREEIGEDAPVKMDIINEFTVGCGGAPSEF